MTEAGERIPRLRRRADFSRVQLTGEEGFLLSRIDGRTSVHLLAQLLGRNPNEVEELLRRLVREGLVTYQKPGEEALDASSDLSELWPTGKKPTNRAPSASDYGEFEFPEDRLIEVCDLTEEERKRILWFEAHLEIWTYYDILQVDRRADAKAIKRAYFARSKEWHPDRFRRPILGSFAKSIERIFGRIQHANKALEDEKSRTAYDQSTVFEASATDLDEFGRAQNKLEREARRALEREERRLRNNPLRQRVQRSRELIQHAEEAKATGDVTGALRALKLAQAYSAQAVEGSNNDIDVLAAAASGERVEAYIKRGRKYESLLHWAEAVAEFRTARGIAPEKGEVMTRLAYCLLHEGTDIQEARQLAQQGAALLPDDPDAHYVLGLCYEKVDMDKLAQGSYAKALELKPNHGEAKKRIKKLKWGF
jgi:curved DNA-binding protein CbpA